MTGARYCALGVLNDSRTSLAEFLTSGLEDEQEELIGERPTGLGVLGLLISDPQTLRLSRLDSHPESFGFPPNHPAMTSFLGVPIKAAWRGLRQPLPHRQAGLDGVHPRR